MWSNHSRLEQTELHIYSLPPQSAWQTGYFLTILLEHTATEQLNYTAHPKGWVYEPFPPASAQGVFGRDTPSPWAQVSSLHSHGHYHLMAAG